MPFQDLPQPSKVGDGAGEAVQPVDDDLLDQPFLYVLYHPLESGAVGVLAGIALVLVDAELRSGLLPAQVDLPLDGEAVRLVHGLPGIDRVQDGHLLSSTK